MGAPGPFVFEMSVGEQEDEGEESLLSLEASSFDCGAEAVGAHWTQSLVLQEAFVHIQK